MKYLMIVACFLSTSYAMAAEEDANNQQDQMQELLQQAKKQQENGLNTQMVVRVKGMHDCMDKQLGESSMMKIEQSNRDQDAQIQALCKEDKKAEALAMQNQQAAELVKSPEYKAMHDCAKGYPGLLQEPAGGRFADAMKRGLPKQAGEVCVN